MLLASQKFLFSTSYEYWLLSFENEVALSTPLNPAIASIDETSQRIFFGWTRDGVNNYPILTELNWNGRLLDSSFVTRDGGTNTHLHDIKFEPSSEYLLVGLLGKDFSGGNHNVVGYDCSTVGAITYSWAKTLYSSGNYYEDYIDASYLGMKFSISNDNNLFVSYVMGTSSTNSYPYFTKIEISTGAILITPSRFSGSASSTGEAISGNSSRTLVPYTIHTATYYQKLAIFFGTLFDISLSIGSGDYLVLGSAKHNLTSGYSYLSGNVVDGSYYNPVVLKMNYNPETYTVTKSWEKKISNTANTSRFQPRMEMDSNENLYIVWTTPSADTIFIHKIDSDGTVVWKNKLTHSSKTMKGCSLQITETAIFLSFVEIGTTTVPMLLKFPINGSSFHVQGYTFSEDTTSSIATSNYIDIDFLYSDTCISNEVSGENVTSGNVSVSNPKITYYK